MKKLIGLIKKTYALAVKHKWITILYLVALILYLNLYISIDFLKTDDSLLTQDSESASYGSGSIDYISRIKNCQNLDVNPDKEEGNKNIITEDYSDTSFKMISIVEQTWRDSPALAVVFSKPIKKENFQQHLTVSRIGDSANNGEDRLGNWILNKSQNIAYLPFISPETPYKITIQRGILSIDNEELPYTYVNKIKTRSKRPSVGFYNCGSLFNSKLADGMPIKSLNVKQVYIDFWKVHPNQIKQFFSDNSRESYYELRKMSRFAKLIYSSKYDVENYRQNKSIKSIINFQEIDELKNNGVYFMVMKSAEDYPTQYATTWFSVSDIGVQVRKNEDHLNFFAHSFLTSEPINGANIKIIFQKDHSPVDLKTDVQGFATYNRNTVKKEALAIVEDINQKSISVLPLNQQLIDLGGFHFPVKTFKESELFLYGPRDVYRPGETVEIYGLLRDHDGRVKSGNNVLFAKLFDPTRSKVQDFRLKPENDAGLYTTEIKTYASGKTGRWNLRIEYLGNTFNYPFLVEDFIPEEFRITLKPENALFMKHDEDISINAEAMYLYGSPAAENNWQAEIQFREVKTFNRFLEKNNYFNDKEKYSQWKNFRFGLESESKFDFNYTLKDRKLSADGTGEILKENSWDHTDRPLRIITVFDVFNAGGRPNTRSIEQIVIPENGLYAIKPVKPLKNDRASPYSDIEFEVARFLTDGNFGSGKVNVEVERVSDRYFLTDRGRWRYSKSRTKKTIYYKTLKLTKKSKKFTLPVIYGDYLVTVYNSAGKEVNSFHFFAGWTWDRGSKYQEITPDKINLSVDKEEYLPGEEIKLSFTPPYPGRALVMVEDKEILWKNEVVIEGSQTEISIPVGNWIGNHLYASVYMIRPLLNLKNGRDSFPDISKRAIGFINIPLKKSHRRLHPEIIINDEVPSGSKMTVAVHLPQTDLQKRQSEGQEKNKNIYLTLAAVDSGVLSVNNFKTPDPFGYFLSPRGYANEIIDNYGEIIRPLQLTHLHQRFGGDALTDINTGGDILKTDVEIVSFFTKPIVFDAQGKAETQFDLPDFNGEVRLMATVFDQSRYGSAEKNISVVSPLITELYLPRFIAHGDSSKATLHLLNNTEVTRSYQVVLNSEPILGGEKVDKSITLAANEKQVVHLPIFGNRPQGGVGKVVMSINEQSTKKDRFSIQQEKNLSVRPIFPAEIFTKSKIINPQAEASIEIPEVNEMFIEGKKAIFSLSKKPPIEFETYLKKLIQYPYGCLEQTTSRAFPLLIASEADLRKYDQSEKKNITQERVALVDKAIIKLMGMQKENGGFGLWSRKSSEEHWLTAYVLDFLITAKNKGYPVPAHALERGIDRLKTYLTQFSKTTSIRRHYSAWPEHYLFSFQAYSALVLARLNKANISDLRNIYDKNHSDSRSLLPYAQFALAFELLGDKNRAQKAWTEALLYDRYMGKRYGGAYGSDVRDIALTMVLLSQSKLNLEKFGRLLELNNIIQDRRWLSTQENFSLFLLSKALKNTEDNFWSAVVNFDKSKIDFNRENNNKFLIDAAVIPSVKIKNENAFNLYGNYQVQGYLKNPKYNVQEGMVVNRKYYDQNGSSINLDQFNTGEAVVVKVVVESRLNVDIPNAMLVDLLPAGFELENQNLAHSLKTDEIFIDGKTIKEQEDANPFEHREYRDDRFIVAFDLPKKYSTTLFYLMRAVTPGEYSVPPSVVEDMYRPYYRAIGKKERKTVISEL